MAPDISSGLITGTDVDGAVTPRSAATRLQHLVDHTTGWVNVKSYGATGDGTTDDTASIQAAVNASAGKTLVASGTFRINSVSLISGAVYDFSAATFVKGATPADGMFDLNGVTNVQVYGGKFTGDASSAQYTDPLVSRKWIQGSAVYMHGGCSHVKWDGGTFDGTVTGWYSGASGWFTGFSIYDSNHVEVVNTRHMNANAGINVQATSADVFNVKVNQNTVTGGGDDGITFMTNDTGVTRSLFNCEAIGNTLDKTGMDTTQVAGVGIRVARAVAGDIGAIHHVAVVGNTFRNMNTSALYVNHATDCAIGQNIVNGYALKSSGGTAFWIGDDATATVSRLAVTGNTITGGANAPAKALEADNVTESTFTGNVLSGNVSGFGALDLHWSTHNIVQGNRVINADAASSGVQTGDSSDYNTITGNDVTGSAGVSVGGANDVSHSNVGAAGQGGVDLAKHTSGWANVKAYGATGNGSTNDRDAIQAAIDAVTTSKGVVYIPSTSASYKIASTITVPDGVTIRGGGRSKTILAYTGSGTAFSVPTAGVRTYNQTFSDFHLFTSTGAIGFDLDSVSSADFTRAEVQGFSDVGWYIHSNVLGGAVYNTFYKTTATACGTGYRVLGQADPTPAWSGGTTYAAGEYATYSAISYRSLQAANTNQQPDTSPAWWTVDNRFRGNNGHDFISARAANCSVRGWDIRDVNDITITGGRAELCGVGFYLDSQLAALADNNRLIAPRTEACTTGILINSANVRYTLIEGAWFGSNGADITDNATTTRRAGQYLWAKTSNSVVGLDAGWSLSSGAGFTLGTTSSSVLAATGAPLYLRGAGTDAAGTVGAWIGNSTTLTTTGARIAGFSADSPVVHASPKAYITLEGFYEFANGMKIGYAAAMPASGTWTQGTVIYNSSMAAGAAVGWARITTGAGNVLNTDWKALANL